MRELSAAPKEGEKKCVASVSLSKRSEKVVVSVKNAAKRGSANPPLFKFSVKRAGGVVISIPSGGGEPELPPPPPPQPIPDERFHFTLDDLDAYFKDRANNVIPKLSKKDFGVSGKKKSAVKKARKGAVKLENKSVGVATIFDILGFNPVETPSVEKLESLDVPRKWKKYYNKLVELRAHHSAGVESRSSEVMKHSDKEDSGDLSSNGQHLADAGSASFERDLAYNMITNQTEILAEIDAAIKRIKDGTYGICEVTGKPIPEARLSAIPFARYTKEGQEIHELEQRRVKSVRRDGGVFDISMDAPAQKSDDDDADADL